MSNDRWNLESLDEALEAARRDAQALVAGVTPESGSWRREPGSWSVAECLDHLATSNRTYLQAMETAAADALRAGSRRRGPPQPGFMGRWVLWTLEPPVKKAFRARAPQLSRPRVSPPLSEAFAQFLESQDEVRAFLRKYAEIDLAGTQFQNPFVRGVRFSLATGLHIIAAHERRHLWQAWRVRREAEKAAA